MSSAKTRCSLGDQSAIASRITLSCTARARSRASLPSPPNRALRTHELAQQRRRRIVGHRRAQQRQERRASGRVVPESEERARESGGNWFGAVLDKLGERTSRVKRPADHRLGKGPLSSRRSAAPRRDRRRLRQRCFAARWRHSRRQRSGAPRRRGSSRVCCLGHGVARSVPSDRGVAAVHRQGRAGDVARL